MSQSDVIIPQRCVKCEGRAILVVRNDEVSKEVRGFAICDEKTKCKHEREVEM